MNLLFSRGFTFVELIVVIAIIGILTSVILASLSDARSSGVEAKIKSELVMLVKRAKIEEFQSLTNDVVCGSNGFATATKIMDLITEIQRFSPEPVVCNSSTGAFAVSAALSSTTYWCVDSTGSSRGIGVALGAGDLACP